MPMKVAIRKTFLYKWGKEEGLKEGEQRGIVKGKQEGLREGLKKAILLDADAKFGNQKAKQIKNLLDKVNDIKRLEKIKKEIIKAETWDDFVRVFRNHK
jgi:predicted transposase YdaD